MLYIFSRTTFLLPTLCGPGFEVAATLPPPATPPLPFLVQTTPLFSAAGEKKVKKVRPQWYTAQGRPAEKNLQRPRNRARTSHSVMSAPTLSSQAAEIACQSAELARLRAESSELARLRAETSELARLREELAQSRAVIAELRPLAAEEAARQKQRQGFISALIIAAQNGYAREVDPFVGLCRETWGEEALFDALKDLPHGKLRLRSAEEAVAAGLPEFDPYGMGRTRLMCAAQAGNKARVEWLLKRGARLELADSDGFTALTWVSACGYTDVVELLVGKGALVSGAVNPPLFIASGYGYLDIVRVLLNK